MVIAAISSKKSTTSLQADRPIVFEEDGVSAPMRTSPDRKSNAAIFPVQQAEQVLFTERTECRRGL